MFLYDIIRTTAYHQNWDLLPKNDFDARCTFAWQKCIQHWESQTDISSKLDLVTNALIEASQTIGFYPPAKIL